MSAEIGEKVQLFKKTKTGYKLLGNFTVEYILKNSIGLRKDTGYLETIHIVDLRQKKYKLVKENGEEIRFKPMVNVKEIERIQREKEMEEYRRTIGKSCYKSMMKKGDSKKMNIREAIQKKLNEGKDINAIVDELVAEGIDKRVVARFAVEFGYQPKYAKKKKQEQVHEIVKKAVKEEREAIDRKLKYYISTGWDNRVKAEQLAKVITAAGGEITYKWWELEYTEDAVELAKRGEAELKGVQDADVVVVMMPGHFGTHTEFGAALSLRKKILLYNPGAFDVMPFYFVSGVRQVLGGELDLVAEILKTKD